VALSLNPSVGFGGHYPLSPVLIKEPRSPDFPLPSRKWERLSACLNYLILY